jgi:hypothetical protein
VCGRPSSPLGRYAAHPPRGSIAEGWGYTLMHVCYIIDGFIFFYCNTWLDMLYVC